MQTPGFPPTRRRPATPPPDLAVRNGLAARLATRAQKIPKDTTDVRSAMKRLLWLRGMSTVELAAATRLSPSYWKARLGSGPGHLCKIRPGNMDRFLDAIGATPKERRRLHLLGALDAGWKLENANADA